MTGPRRLDGALALHALPRPSDADVEVILARVARRVLAALGDTDDSHADDGLDAWTAHLGAALQPTLPRLATDDPPPRPPRPRTATAVEAGWTGLENTRIPGTARWCA